MKTIDNRCPICKNNNLKKRFQVDNYHICYCNNCSIEFNANFPPKITSKATFSKEYYLDVQKEAFVHQRKYCFLDPSIPYYKRGLQQIKRFTSGRDLLDVGAGLGTFMKIASEGGWKVRGIEISPYGYEFIKNKYNFNIFSEDLNAINFPAASFDVITFWDVIEHAEYPKESLTKAYELLRPRGIVLITSDNYNSLITTIARAFYYFTFGTFKYPIKRIFTPYNRTYFNDNNFRRLLEETGFKIIFFQKMHYPIQKLRLNLIEKFMLYVLYKLEYFFNRQSQFTYIVQK